MANIAKNDQFDPFGSYKQGARSELYAIKGVKRDSKLEQLIANKSELPYSIKKLDDLICGGAYDQRFDKNLRDFTFSLINVLNSSIDNLLNNKIFEESGKYAGILLRLSSTYKEKEEISKLIGNYGLLVKEYGELINPSKNIFLQIRKRFYPKKAVDYSKKSESPKFDLNKLAGIINNLLMATARAYLKHAEDQDSVGNNPELTMEKIEKAESCIKTAKKIFQISAPANKADNTILKNLNHLNNF